MEMVMKIKKVCLNKHSVILDATSSTYAIKQELNIKVRFRSKYRDGDPNNKICGGNRQDRAKY